MPPAARFLHTNSGHHPVAEPPDPLAVDSDVVVILTALLCTLIFAVSLVLLARWLRRCSGLGGGREPSPPLSDKGLKNKTIRSILKISYAGAGGRVADCPICLADFVEASCRAVPVFMSNASTRGYVHTLPAPPAVRFSSSPRPPLPGAAAAGRAPPPRPPRPRRRAAQRPTRTETPTTSFHELLLPIPS